MIDPNTGPQFNASSKYSITLNPPDQHQYFGDPKRESKLWAFSQKELLKTGVRYQLWMELSEPMGFHTALDFKGPRLHFHGVISFDDKKQLWNFLTTGYYSLTRWTAIDIDTIEDLDKWISYCTKQRVVRKKYRLISNVFRGTRLSDRGTRESSSRP